MVLKTWGNSWATSYRFHEPVLLPCLFGCYHGIDKLAHYVVCPWLFKFVSLLRPGTSSNPLERIAMHNPTLDSVKVVACTFSGYHAIKCTPHLCKLASTNRTDSCALLSTAVSFAEAFLASSHAMCLQCVCLNTFRENLAEFLGESLSPPPPPPPPPPPQQTSERQDSHEQATPGSSSSQAYVMGRKGPCLNPGT